MGKIIFTLVITAVYTICLLELGSTSPSDRIVCNFCELDTEENENGMLVTKYREGRHFYACFANDIYRVACDEVFTEETGDRFNNKVCVINRDLWALITSDEIECSQIIFPYYNEDLLDDTEE